MSTTDEQAGNDRPVRGSGAPGLPGPAGTPGTGLEAAAFPGQGVDPNDLGRILAARDDDPLVGKLADHLGHRRWDELDINDTRVAQPAVFCASYLAARDHLDRERIGAVVGHSLGELAACCFAGVLTPARGLDLVVRRADLGHEQQEQRPGRMIVVMRLEAAEVEWIRRLAVARDGGVLEWAVVNGPGQFVLSGDRSTADTAIELIAEHDGVGRPLPIGGAYHSPLMEPAVASYREAIDRLEPADPGMPVVSCTTATAARTAGEVRENLARALVLPVRWVEAMTAVRELGIDHAVDTGPGLTLANLARFAPVLGFRALSPPPASRSRKAPRRAD